MGVLKSPKQKSSVAAKAGLGGGVVAALIALSILVVLLLFDVIPTFRTETIERNQPPVLQRLERLNKFKAASGTFEVIIDLEKDVDGVPSVIAGERTVMIASGEVDAEVDFTGLKGSSVKVSNDGKKVEVVVPPPQLTDARIDNTKSRIVTRSRGIFARIGDALSDDPVNDQELYVGAEDELEKAAKESELLSKAQDNTEDMLKQMLTTLGFDEVVVTFDENAIVVDNNDTSAVEVTVTVPSPR